MGPVPPAPFTPAPFRRSMFVFLPELGPQKADLSISGAEMHSATRRVFWDASRRRRSPLEAETAEIRNPALIRNPAFLQPPSSRPHGP